MLGEKMNPQLIWLDDPQIFQVNRLPAHSDHDHFGSLEEIKKRASSMFQSLNGAWKFCYSACAGKRPAVFFKEDFDASSFDEMKVPQFAKNMKLKKNKDQSVDILLLIRTGNKTTH